MTARRELVALTRDSRGAGEQMLMWLNPGVWKMRPGARRSFALRVTQSAFGSFVVGADSRS